MRDWVTLGVVGCLLVAGYCMWLGTRRIPDDPPLPVAQPRRVASATSSAAQPDTVSQTAPPSSQATIVESAAAFLREGALAVCADLKVEEPAAIATAFAKATDAGAQFMFDQELEYWATGQETMIGDGLARLHKGSDATLRPKGDLQMLRKRCSEQFSRAAVASCAVEFNSKPAADAPTIKSTLRFTHYQIPDDTVMSNCIAAGGEWQEAARDSIEYIHANTENAMRRLHRQLGQ